MGFVSSVMGATAQASQYDAQKRRVLIEGEAAKQQAYTKAGAVEREGKRKLHETAENMERAAANRRREMGAARAAGAGRGFTSEGSGDIAEQMVSKAHTLQMGDIARRGSETYRAAADEGIGLRRHGDEAMRAAEAEAAQLRAMAKASRTGAWFNAIGGVIGAGVGAYQGYQGAEAYNELNAEAIKAGKMTAADAWQNAGWGSITGADGGSGFMASGNPFTAHLAGDSWQKNLMGMLGVGNIKKK